jgi:hypothetical protein
MENKRINGEMQFIIIPSETKLDNVFAHRMRNIISNLGKYYAAIWSPQQYKQNEPTIMSNQKFILLGESDIAKSNINSVEWKFEKLNMRYGWLGSVAIIDIQKKLAFTKAEIEELDKLFSDQNQTKEKIRGIYFKNKERTKKIKSRKSCNGYNLYCSCRYGRCYRSSSGHTQHFWVFLVCL